MHNAGSIFWFENRQGLREYIFHKIPEITNMVKILFDHCSEDQWQQRLSSFTSFGHGDEMISKEYCQWLVDDFMFTGVIDAALLIHLLETESKFPPDIALCLLQCFYIVHGPISHNRRSAYAIPYFATKFLDKSWKTDGDLQLRMDILLGGLALPFYVHQVTTVAFLNLLLNDCNTFNLARNGATVYHSSSSTHLIHDSNNRKITLQESTNPTSLGSSWKNLLETASKIISVLSHHWKASRVSVKIYCSHCLFLRDPNPAHKIDPDWFHPVYNGSSSINMRSLKNVEDFCGAEPVSCRRHTIRYKDPKPSVPKPLVFPCE